MAANDDLGGREPTSHERMTGKPWDASYDDGPAPWDVGPQPAIVRLAAEGAIVGPVLDAGCGSGDNALHLASMGLEVTGIDVAETALARARAKAVARGLDVTFEVGDALALEDLGRTFPAVLDCGCLHTFDAEERRRYVDGLASVTQRGSVVHVLCFRAAGDGSGPHPLTDADLRDAFDESRGWAITRLDEDRVLTRFHGDDGAPAWLVSVERT